jgi:hypothetical protein
MPAYKPTKEDYILELQSLGEDPPEDWTVMEIKTRLHEIKEAQGMCLQTNGKKTTPFRVLVIEINKCSKKKALLQEFAKSKMMLPISGHETIPRLQQMCLQKIYETTPATPQDPAGFGMHCSLTYEEIFLNEPDYAKWVVQTAMEGQADHYRLRRLANWLEDRHKEPAKKITVVKAKASKTKKTGAASIGSSASSSSNEALMEMIHNLQEEVAALREERPHKRAEKSDDQMSMGSFRMVSP